MEESRFAFLGSSSSGNSGLLKTDESKVLVDLGFSARRTCQFLRDLNESIDGIDAIFLTHEHGDHARGLSGLAKHADIPVFANRDTARALQKMLSWRPNWHIFETGSKFKHRDIEIQSFSVPHDAYDPVGFTFEWGYDDLFSPRQSLGWLTDLGYVPEQVKECIAHVDTLVLEANYDADLLEKDIKRPWSVKQRIRGRHGHLSNQDAMAFIDEMSASRWKQLYLVHLSRDCNDVNLVNRLFTPLAQRMNKLRLSVIDPDEFCPAPIFF